MDSITQHALQILARAVPQVTPIFKVLTVPDDGATMDRGRPVFREIEAVEVRAPGNTLTTSVFPVHAFSHWETDPETGFQFPLTYAERWPEQYARFKQGLTQLKAGTPLSELTFLTETQRAELRGLSVFTAEDLATIDGQPLRNLGLMGRELKNRAIAWLESAAGNAVSQKQAAQIEELMRRLEALEQENQTLRGDGDPAAPPPAADEEEPPALSLDPEEYPNPFTGQPGKSKAKAARAPV